MRLSMSQGSVHHEGTVVERLWRRAATLCWHPAGSTHDSSAEQLTTLDVRELHPSKSSGIDGGPGCFDRSAVPAHGPCFTRHKIRWCQHAHIITGEQARASANACTLVSQHLRTYAPGSTRLCPGLAPFALTLLGLSHGFFFPSPGTLASPAALTLPTRCGSASESGNSSPSRCTNHLLLACKPSSPTTVRTAWLINRVILRGYRVVRIVSEAMQLARLVLSCSVFPGHHACRPAHRRQRLPTHTL